VGGTKNSLCESWDGEIILSEGPFDNVTVVELIISLPTYKGQFSFAIPIFRDCVRQIILLFIPTSN